MPAKPLFIARWLWVLLGVLALGLGLRVWGIRFGLPFVYHPDEGALVMPALKILQTGDFRPTHLYYGSAYIYSLTTLYIPFFLFSAWRGTLKVVAELPVFVDYFQIGQYPFPGVFLLGRLLTALLGGLTVLTTFVLGRRVSRIVSGQDQDDQAAIWVGLAGAVLLSVEWFHTQNAHFATTDVPMTFILTLAVMRCIEVFQRGHWRDYLWAGFWIGLTASTKFPGGLVFVVLLVAHVLRARDWAEVLDGRLGLGVAVTAAGFFLGTPYALDLPYFLNWLAINVSYFGTTGTRAGDARSQALDGAHYLERAVLRALRGPDGYGRPGVGVGSSGRTGALGGVLMACPGSVRMSVLIASQGARFPRFLVPLMPFLAIGAGRSVNMLARPSGDLLEFRTRYPEWYVQQGFEYMIITEPRLRDPNLTERQVARYQEFRRRYELVQTFKGPMLGTEGRHIWVFGSGLSSTFIILTLACMAASMVFTWAFWNCSIRAKLRFISAKAALIKSGSIWLLPLGGLKMKGVGKSRQVLNRGIGQHLILLLHHFYHLFRPVSAHHSLFLFPFPGRKALD